MKNLTDKKPELNVPRYPEMMLKNIEKEVSLSSNFVIKIVLKIFFLNLRVYQVQVNIIKRDYSMMLYPETLITLESNQIVLLLVFKLE